MLTEFDKNWKEQSSLDKINSLQYFMIVFSTKPMIRGLYFQNVWFIRELHLSKSGWDGWFWQFWTTYTEHNWWVAKNVIGDFETSMCLLQHHKVSVHKKLGFLHKGPQDEGTFLLPQKCVWNYVPWKRNASAWSTRFTFFTLVLHHTITTQNTKFKNYLTVVENSAKREGNLPRGKTTFFHNNLQLAIKAERRVNEC